MPRAVLANCFLPPGVFAGDVVLSDEPGVLHQAAQRGLAAESPERRVDAELAHRTSVEMWRLAYSWYRRDGGDATVDAGVSAGDLAGLEAAITVLGVAARAALSTAAAVSAGLVSDALVTVTPRATPGGARYEASERLAADAAAAVARQLTGDDLRAERVQSSEPGNAQLKDKYARTRDAEFLLSPSALRTARGLAFGLANRVALLRRPRGRSLLVVEYNPTLPLVRAYAPRRPRRRLVRWLADPTELASASWAGDLVLATPTTAARRTPHPPPSAVATSLADVGFTVAGVDLWPIVAPRLFALAGRYAAFARRAAPGLRHRLEQWRVDAVLVPYDNSPAVRLLVRLAQSAGIPTLVINDGYKGDEIQLEGMSTDVALAWSQAIAENYYVRHPGRTIVTGNPRFSGAPARGWRAPPDRPLRVLVGTFTFSGFDLNCRRGDPERFLDEVLTGLGAALGAVSPDVLVKLHPADEPAHYASLVDRHPELRVTLLSTGDVLDLFERCDLYLTTYSTSLLEAAPAMPVVYYRVNPQRVGPPFDGDEYLGPRTATSPEQLARLLRDRDVLTQRPPTAWVERHLGPDGAVDRVLAAVDASISSGSAAAGARTAPGGAPRTSAR